MSGTARLRVFDLTRSGETRLISPEGVIVIVGAAIPRRYERHFAGPRPEAFYVWSSLRGVPPDLYRRFKFGQVPPEPDIRQVSRARRVVEIDNHVVWEAKEGRPRITLCSLEDDDTRYLGLFFTEHGVGFQRAGKEIFRKFPPNFDRSARFSVEARWSPSLMRVSILYQTKRGSVDEVVSSVRFGRVVVLPADIVRSVLMGAPENVEQPAPLEFEIGEVRNAYEDDEDVLDTIRGVLSYTRQQLMLASPSGYWDDLRTKPKTLLPKDEPKCGDNLFPLLSSLFANKAISLTREDPSRSGRCDFTLSAVLKSYEQVRDAGALKLIQSTL